MNDENFQIFCEKNEKFKNFQNEDLLNQISLNPPNSFCLMIYKQIKDSQVNTDIKIIMNDITQVLKISGIIGNETSEQQIDSDSCGFGDMGGGGAENNSDDSWCDGNNKINQKIDIEDKDSWDAKPQEKLDDSDSWCGDKQLPGGTNNEDNDSFGGGFGERQLEDDVDNDSFGDGFGTRQLEDPERDNDSFCDKVSGKDKAEVLSRKNFDIFEYMSKQFDFEVRKAEVEKKLRNCPRCLTSIQECIKQLEKKANKKMAHKGFMRFDIAHSDHLDVQRSQFRDMRKKEENAMCVRPWHYGLALRLGNSTYSPKDFMMKLYNALINDDQGRLSLGIGTFYLLKATSSFKLQFCFLRRNGTRILNMGNQD